ncbi:MAG: YkgJ family cysteine cluster protein [Aquamicrobium sp.]|uniref:YkgJ family cysteine cluster protein n=1 Tax=Aquamicrobium sp. TaxID=1872579 RepID=UPI00349EBEE5|nr:YkgJ family cysteine cluster protein [Aquamicrobium sp.]
MNACGTCTMCCKLLGISDLAPRKPVNQWCRHCKPGNGCTIYEDRPRSCREFECLWLQSQTKPHPMGPELRPDKSKVVIAPTSSPNVMTAFVDPAQPLAWREGGMKRILERLAKIDVRVVISLGISTRKTLIEKHGGAIRERTITMSDPDESGMQWYDPMNQSE